MKKVILIIFASALIFGCTPLNPAVFDKHVVLFEVDYTKFSEKGFLFSPYEYKQGEFEVLSQLEIEIVPEVKKAENCFYDKKKVMELRAEGYNYVKAKNAQNCYLIQIPKPQEILDLYHEKAINYGGNGVSSFKLEIETRSNGAVDYKVVRAHGIVIKRKV